jgi:hypothetical protein
MILKPLVRKFIRGFGGADLSSWTAGTINSSTPKSTRESVLGEVPGVGREIGPQVIRTFHPMFCEFNGTGMMQSS